MARLERIVNSDTHLNQTKMSIPRWYSHLTKVLAEHDKSSRKFGPHSPSIKLGIDSHQ